MRGILFDLDGTLLDIDLQAFLDRYFDSLCKVSAPILPEGVTAEEFIASIDAATRAMMSPHPGETNATVFSRVLFDLAGVDMDEAWPVYERFYAEEFPSLKDGAQPAPGARDAVRTAFDLGLKVVIATNPIFPRDAVMERLAWAELDDLPYDGITTYEIMTACKPSPVYFREAAALAGLQPQECMMVGDDRFLDMPASDTGMRTFFVGEASGALWTDLSGTLQDLAGLLPRLVRSSAG